MISELKIIKCLCDKCKMNKTSMVDANIDIRDNIVLLPLYWKRIDGKDLCFNCVKIIEIEKQKEAQQKEEESKIDEI